MAIVRVTGGPDASSRAHRLGDMPFVIGRAQSCDLPIEDKLSSRKHCRIVPQNGGFSVEDLGSRNGTLLNDKPLESNTPLETGDVIRIGEVQITFDAEGAVSHTGESVGAPGVIATNSGEPPFGAPGTLYELRFSGRCGTFNRTLNSPVTTVGRSEEADLQIQEPLASRIHCQFEVKSTGVKVVDLESRNGTQVNGATVNQKFLQRHDRIQVGESIIVIGSRLPPTTSELVGVGVATEARKPTAGEADDLRSPLAMQAAGPSPMIVWTDDGSQKRHEMTSDRVVIGRSEKVEVPIKEQLASREHVAVKRLPNGSFEVEDLGSRNGTRLNGRELRGKIELVSGDVIQIGSVSLRFEVPGMQSAAATGSDARVVSARSSGRRSSGSSGTVRAASGTHPAAAMAEQGGGGGRRRRRRRTTKGGSEEGMIGMIVGLVVVVLAVIGLMVALNSGGGSSSSGDGDSDRGGSASSGNTVQIRPVNRTPRNNSGNPANAGSNGSGTNGNATPRNNSASNDASNGSSSANNNGGRSNNPPASNNRNGSPENQPPDNELGAWADAPGLSDSEREMRRLYVERYHEVQKLLDDPDGPRYGDAVRALDSFMENDGRIGADAAVDRAYEERTDTVRMANQDWRTNFAPKVSDTDAGERQAKWGSILTHHFSGIRGITQEAADLGVTIGSG